MTNEAASPDVGTASRDGRDALAAVSGLRHVDIFDLRAR